MSSARIHDKSKVKSFWEKIIVQHMEEMGREDGRIRNSALARLKEIWWQRLMQKHELQKGFFEERLNRAKRAAH